MKTGRYSFGKQNGAHKGFEHTSSWRMNRIDIELEIDWLVVLQVFAFRVTIRVGLVYVRKTRYVAYYW